MADGAAPQPRLMVCGLASSSGKTTVAAGLLGALRRRGARVQGYKVGPDFLDPQVLSAAAGVPARNLDAWLTGPRRMRRAFQASAPRGDGAFSIIEGMMGALDAGELGTSSLDVARALDTPVLLVLDAAAASESLAVHARGARALFGRDRLAGVIVNRAGAARHAGTVRRAVEQVARVPVLGVLPWLVGASLPERHLGLATPTTDPGASMRRRLRAAVDLVSDAVDLDRIAEVARSAPDLPEPATSAAPRSGSSRRPDVPSGRGVTVAVARDAACCFLYTESLEALAATGARLRYFSPLRGDAVPAGAGSLYLPGGYPELHGPELARWTSLHGELRRWVRDGRPLLAECGGMMLLLDRLRDGEGRVHRMAGAFPGSARMSSRLGGFGYAEAELLRPCLLGDRGERIRGHLYHHSVRRAPAGVPWALSVRSSADDRSWRDGYARGGALASYLHVRLDTCPGLVARLTDGWPAGRPGPSRPGRPRPSRP